MGNDVFANGREISCKAADGKALCAFPDVCFTPPQTGATPPGVPIPYPNTAFAKDSAKGSKKVKISGKEVMLKNKSYFKKSTGDEPGSTPKKGVITSKITGKVYFNSWSMDVKFEGQNVVRHLDLTTHNHASFPGNSPTWPYLDSMAFEGQGPCKEVAKGIKDNCLGTERNEAGEEAEPLFITDKKGETKRKPTLKAMCNNKDCKKSLKCVVSPKEPNNCCPDEKGKQPTPHHIVPKSQFYESGFAGKSNKAKRDKGALLCEGKKNKYSPSKAPCICAEGKSHSEGKHGDIHAETNTRTREAMGVESGKRIPSSERWDVSKAESIGAEAVEEVTQCPKGCVEDQVRKGHEKMGIKKNDKIRPTTAGGEEKNHAKIGKPFD
ncbi:MAG: DUF4150 domain-containing protein [Desulfobacteraceae bacterium]|nr:DUF4150 domain-containing protein [Desulfobacteraceae bacterium]